MDKFKGCKLQQWSSESSSAWGWSQEHPWDLYSWRYSNLNLLSSWITCSNWLCFEQGHRLEICSWSLPTWIILCFSPANLGTPSSSRTWNSPRSSLVQRLFTESLRLGRISEDPIQDRTESMTDLFQVEGLALRQKEMGRGWIIIVRSNGPLWTTITLQSSLSLA